MDDAQILTIVDSSTSLDDVCGERRTNLPQSTSDKLSTLLMEWIVIVDRREMVDGNEVTHEVARYLVLVPYNADLHYLQLETARRSLP